MKSGCNFSGAIKMEIEEIEENKLASQGAGFCYFVSSKKLIIELLT